MQFDTLDIWLFMLQKSWKNLFLIFICAMLSFSFSIGDYFSYEKFTYLDTTDGKIATTNIIVKKEDDKIIITKSSFDEVNIYEYTDKYTLLKATSKILGKDKENSILLEKNKIVIEKGHNNKEKRYKIDLPWIQEFTFGLRPFLSSNKQKQGFYTINPDNFDLVELVAIKKGIVNFTIKNEKYKAQQLKITLPGFKGSFWSAKAIFDLESGNLLQYEANKGPGTPTTLTTIDAEQTN